MIRFELNTTMYEKLIDITMSHGKGFDASTYSIQQYLRTEFNAEYVRENSYGTIYFYKESDLTWFSLHI